MKGLFLLYLKGILMGVCDLIPGISGGTIAFITGIYERLINSVKGFSPQLIFSLRNKNEFKKNIQKLDLIFLITLLLGIFTALILGSGIMKYLLENHYTYTLSFFVGLIVASSFIIFENIKNHNMKNIFVCFIGFIIGILLAFVVPASIEPTTFYIFLGGFIGISAMFLPGISGSFILLIMGLYEFMINVLHDISNNIMHFIVFFIGAIFGALFISRIISFLFKKDQCKTLYFLLGLVIGALSIPLKKIIEASLFRLSEISLMVFLFLLGILLVVIVKKYNR
jgi:putative membrane protein